MKRLIIVRHGQTDWNIQGKNQGHTDIELNDTGIKESHQLKRVLESSQIDKVFSSPLLRARRTAEILTEGRKIEIKNDFRLRERSYGQWEGKTREQVFSASPDELSDYLNNPETSRPKEGESGIDVFCRASYFITDVVGMIENESTYLIVSHGGTIANLVSVLIGGSPKTANSFRFNNCSLTEFVSDQHTNWKLLRLNEVPQLND